MKREFVTGDRGLEGLIQLAKTVAPSRAVVMLLGEMGTGKRFLARLIHEWSSRNSQPFLRISAADTQVEDLQKQLEKQRNSSLYIHEIAALPKSAQEFLISWFQSSAQDATSARIIVSTKLQLTDLVKQGKFSEQLLECMNTVQLRIPGLRERMGDVEKLAKYFVRRNCERSNRSMMGVSEDAIQLLNAHSWPGNVRELEAVLERAMIVSSSDQIEAREIHIHTIPQSSSKPNSLSLLQNWKPGRTLDDIERTVILEALKYHAGNRTHTAKSLGISIRTLRNKLAEYRVLGIKV